MTRFIFFQRCVFFASTAGSVKEDNVFFVNTKQTDYIFVYAFQTVYQRNDSQNNEYSWTAKQKLNAAITTSNRSTLE